MTPNLCELPSDVLLMIAEELEPKFALHLSAASSRLREIVARAAFRKIKFTSDKSSATSALAAARKYGQWTQELDFFGTSNARMPRSAANRIVTQHQDFWAAEDGADPDKSEARISRRRCLCKAAEELLEGAATPHLRKIRFELYFPFGHTLSPSSQCVPWGYDWENHRPFIEELEDYRRTETEEAEYFWRAFSAAVWRAIASNKTITRLVVAEFMPKPTTVFSEDRFKQLLGRLQEFDMSILQRQDPICHRLNRSAGLIQYLQAMTTNFTGHLKSVEKLHIRASPEAPMGARGKYDIPLPLEGQCVRHLRTLELQNCFIGSDLVKAISNSRALKGLTLLDCYAYWDERRQTKNMTWEEFFMELPAIGAGLSSLEILPFDQPLCSRETTNWDVSGSERLRVYSPGLSGTSQEIRRTLEDDPHNRLFGYASLSFSGFFIRSDEINIKRFREGVDLRAYKQVLEFLEGNRNGAARRRTLMSR